MSRRASLPGADELFRRTSGEPEAAESVAAPATVPVAGVAVLEEPEAEPALDSATEAVGRRPAPRRRARGGADRRPTGRERHEEKITVYVSPEELVDLEQAKLVLRAQHGLGVDRGRIVREAIAVVIADLDAKGDESILVRRLRGL
jgi:uncharacterized protein (DUF885 family)